MGYLDKESLLETIKLVNETGDEISDPTKTELIFVDGKPRTKKFVGYPTERFWAIWRSDKDRVRALGYGVFKGEDDNWRVYLYKDPLKDESFIKQVNLSESLEGDPIWPCPDGMRYLDFQNSGIHYAMMRDACIIADPMGLGKTIMAIGVSNSIPRGSSTLVVCPAFLKGNWQLEFAKWDAWDRRVYVINDNNTPDPSAHVYIINYDRLSQHYDFLKSRDWGLVILDEAHYLKSPKANRTRLIFGKPPYEGLRAKKWLALTGTPVLNRPIELWPILEKFDPEGLGRSYISFVTRYCDAKRVKVAKGKTVLDVSGASNLIELNFLLRARLMLRRDRDKALSQMPKIRRKILNVDVEDRAAVELMRLEAELVDKIGGIDTVLEKLSSGSFSAHISELSSVRRDLAKFKAPIIAERIKDAFESEEIEDGKVIVFCWHREVAESLANAISDGLEGMKRKVVCLHGEMPSAERERLVAAFQNEDEPSVIVGTISSIGVGLTMTRARLAIFAEFAWTWAELEQAESRAARLGQQHSVLFEYYTINNSLDAKVLQAAFHKKGVTSALLGQQTGNEARAGQWLSR